MSAIIKEKKKFITVTDKKSFVKTEQASERSYAEADAKFNSIAKKVAKKLLI